MAEQRRWKRLDNAAKIFPPTSSKRDTKVFRFICELEDNVDKRILQEALERTIEGFTMYRSLLKQGVFWYYLEESRIKTEVVEETLPICSQIYDPGYPDLLFRVSYYKKRVNLEIFHVLTDGTGAIKFFRKLIAEYLSAKYNIKSNFYDDHAPIEHKESDAFYQYYDKNESVTKEKKYKAYQVRGELLPDYRLGVIEGLMSAKALLKISRESGATLSEFIVVTLMVAMYEGTAVRDRKHPIVITVPVDLRRFFPSDTFRNFFGVIRIAYDFGKESPEFKDVLASVTRSFKEQLEPGNLKSIISRYSALENNPFLRAVPLILKKPILRYYGFLSRREESAAISNVGRIDMPDELAPYIRYFDVVLDTKRPQLCMCSFEDTLAISVSSSFKETDLQMRFFRRLSDQGLDVQVISNLEQTYTIDEHKEGNGKDSKSKNKSKSKSKGKSKYRSKDRKTRGENATV